MKQHSWQEKLAEGKAGCDEVVATLRSAGLTVTDVQDDPDWQASDVDLLVNGTAVEVKTEAWAETNVFLELTCGDGPGALFKSTADVWVINIRTVRVLLCVALADLQDYVVAHKDEYKLHTITSRRGKRTWTATGIAVPIKRLLADLNMRALPLQAEDEQEGKAA